MASSQPAQDLGQLILTLRGQRVILDADLAALYDVPTKALNQAVKRNADRFPRELRFILQQKKLQS
jgi:ORF6N domain